MTTPKTTQSVPTGQQPTREHGLWHWNIKRKKEFIREFKKRVELEKHFQMSKSFLDENDCDFILELIREKYDV